MAELCLARHPFLFAALVNAAALFIVLGSLELVLLVMLPVAAGLAWVLVVMGIPATIQNLGIVTVVMVATTVGGLFLVRADLALFRGQREPRTATLGSFALCALTTMVGFGALAVARGSELTPARMHAFLGMEASLAAAMLLVPAGARMFLRRSACGGAPRLHHLAGGLWCLVYLVVIHFILLAIALPIAILIHPRSRELRARWLRRLARPGLAGLAHTFPYGKVICTGFSRDAFSKPAVIVSNHESIVDIPILARMPCDLRLTIKGQWWAHPLIGAGVKALGHIRVERGDPDSVIRECSKAFAQGSSIHFFPQGTRSRYDAPVRFHKGAFELAIHLNAEIQPVVLCDTWTCLPRGAIWVENSCMRMRALPRITPSTFDYALGAKALAKHAEELIYRAWMDELELNNTPVILRRKVGRLYRYQGPRAALGVFFRLRRDPGLLKLHSLVPRRGLVLDLGCGYGATAHWLAQSGPERKLLGVDRNAEKIRVARCSACGSQQVAFEEQDIDTWALPECSAVLLLDVLGSAVTPEAADLLGRAFTALERGGRLLLRVAPAAGGVAAAAATREYLSTLRSLGFTTDEVPAGAGRAILVACK
jgi:1-acyl-sn-glycerol-3-phosphate acyltransferase